MNYLSIRQYVTSDIEASLHMTQNLRLLLLSYLKEPYIRDQLLRYVRRNALPVKDSPL